MQAGRRIPEVICLGLFLCSTMAAVTVIDFENLADSAPVASNYSGLGAVFTGATVLSAGISLNEFEFPPHSGSNVAAADAGSITITFSMPLASFSGYFTHSTALTLMAYGASGNVLGTVHSAFNNNLKLSGDPGSTPNELLQVSAANITRITIAGSGDSTLDDVSFTLQPPGPCPTLSRSYLGISSQFGQPSVNVIGNCSWSATSSATWISVISGSSGTGNGVVQLSIGANSGLMRTGTVTIGNQVFTVIQAGTDTKPPFGVLDTPANGTAGLAGAFNVGGWALSSITVANVGLWRDPVGNEPIAAYGLVFMVNATTIPDRPDVAAAYPGYPNNNFGWGAQILTTGLPGTNGLPRGNGTYKIHAIATDPQGLSTDIGRATVSVNNAASVLPFGTIDTPAQGGTASGTAYVNFGWVLTPQPNIVPVNGSTITVYIDDNPVGHPTYSFSRCDVDFQGLRNSGSTDCSKNGTSPGPVGFFNIDTTKLTNGLHTIQWGVSDSGGHTTGLGSRFFVVQN